MVARLVCEGSESETIRKLEARVKQLELDIADRDFDLAACYTGHSAACLLRSGEDRKSTRLNSSHRL